LCESKPGRKRLAGKSPADHAVAATGSRRRLHCQIFPGGSAEKRGASRPSPIDCGPRRHSPVTGLRFYWLRERDSAPRSKEARASAQLPRAGAFLPPQTDAKAQSRAQARLRAARLLVRDFRAWIAQLAREGKSTADAKISLEICESALAELAEREARIRKERAVRYKYPKKPAR
jgi:hypothetical protein